MRFRDKTDQFHWLQKHNGPRTKSYLAEGLCGIESDGPNYGVVGRPALKLLSRGGKITCVRVRVKRALLFSVGIDSIN